MEAVAKQQTQEVKTAEQLQEEKAERHTIGHIIKQNSIGKRIIKAEILDLREVKEKDRNNLWVHLQDQTGKVTLNVEQKYRDLFKTFSPGDWIQVNQCWGKKEDDVMILKVHANPTVIKCKLPAKSAKPIKTRTYLPSVLKIEFQVEYIEDLDIIINHMKQLGTNQSVNMKIKN